MCTGDVEGACDCYEAFLRAPAGTPAAFDPAAIAAKRAAAKAEAERQAAERRRKAAEAAAELARLRTDSAKLAEVRRILPDYQASRRWLRQNGEALLERLPEK